MKRRNFLGALATALLAGPKLLEKLAEPKTIYVDKEFAAKFRITNSMIEDDFYDFDTSKYKVTTVNRAWFVDWRESNS